jgi:hypothetical protein
MPCYLSSSLSNLSKHKYTNDPRHLQARIHGAEFCSKLKNMKIEMIVLIVLQVTAIITWLIPIPRSAVTALPNIRRVHECIFAY